MCSRRPARCCRAAPQHLQRSHSGDLCPFRDETLGDCLLEADRHLVATLHQKRPAGVETEACLRSAAAGLLLLPLLHRPPLQPPNKDDLPVQMPGTTRRDDPVGPSDRQTSTVNRIQTLSAQSWQSLLDQIARPDGLGIDLLRISPQPDTPSVWPPSTPPRRGNLQRLTWPGTLSAWSMVTGSAMRESPATARPQFPESAHEPKHPFRDLVFPFHRDHRPTFAAMGPTLARVAGLNTRRSAHACSPWPISRCWRTLFRVRVLDTGGTATSPAVAPCSTQSLRPQREPDLCFRSQAFPPTFNSSPARRPWTPYSSIGNSETGDTELGLTVRTCSTPSRPQLVLLSPGTTANLASLVAPDTSQNVYGGSIPLGGYSPRQRVVAGARLDQGTALPELRTARILAPRRPEVPGRTLRRT